MRVGSLFTGIGGLDLGLERAGMTVAWQSEIDPYACRVLAKHWPDTPNLGDITTVDWSTVEHVDLICGGYPCQPFSLAGNRNGDTDPRHLWPHFRDAIRLLRPRWALLENVPARPRRSALRGGEQRWPGATPTQLATAECGCDVADAEGLAVGAGLREGEPGGQRWGRPGDGGGAGHAWAVEPDVGRVAHGVPDRVDRLRCLGNAVVPQVAEYVGRRIMAVTR